MAINSIKFLISKKNLIHNINYLLKTFDKKILAVVKANAYGHDINLITQLLYENGCYEFAVARLSEAEKIISNNNLKKIKILIFESIGKDYLYKIKENKCFQISINDFNELEEATNYGIPYNQMQIKIDFSFGRNGISLNEIEKLKLFISKHNIKFAGIYSHLFLAEYDDGIKLINKFNEIINFLGKENFETIHIQNSASVEKYGNLDFTTHIRVGMLIYGLQGDKFYDKNLKQVFSLEGQIAGIKNIENSKYIAYDTKQNLSVGKCKYLAKIKIGYGDGFLKINQNTKCIINNREFKISSVTMDNSFIEVDSKINVGDKVILYPDPLIYKELFNMEIYELLSIISPRIERIIIE